MFRDRLTIRHFNIGDKLFLEGSPYLHLFFIRQGECRLFSNTNPAHIQESFDG